MDSVLITGVVLVVLFDFSNGVHDASNMVATMIASRAMSPIRAVVLVGAFGFLGPLLGGTAVADTIGGLVDLQGVPSPVAISTVFSGLVGAIVWNAITWWRSIPSSSSHALVGALVGAALVTTGAESVSWGARGVGKVVAALLVSPILGFGLAFVIQRIMRRLLAGARPRINTSLKRAQVLTASALAFAHGTNDAQKGMGIIALLLYVTGSHASIEVPFWAMVVCAGAMLLGTVSGGWRIVRTLGYGIFRLRPIHGLDAQLASAVAIFGVGQLGGPVSTTHVVASSIMGVGAAERPRAVRWTMVSEIGWTWVITLPASAVFGAGCALVARWMT